MSPRVKCYMGGWKCQRPQERCARAGSGVSGARGSCGAQGPLASPLPGAQVHDQEPVVLVGVDVVEEVEGRGAVLEVEEPAFLLLCHVEPHLGTKQQLGLGSGNGGEANGPPSLGLAAPCSPVWDDPQLTPMVSLDSKQSM